MQKLISLLIACLASLHSFGQSRMSMHNISQDSQRDTYRAVDGHKVTYHLYVADTMVQYVGKKPKMAIAVNGHIPAPVLDFTVGDTAWIYVHNNMHMETSLHWHGLILPNQEDGVPFLTSSLIPAGGTHLYKFPITHAGTYWYHSHAMLQEQSGLYGAFIVHAKDEDRSNQYTLVLSDWTNDKPEQVNRFLHNASDWYAIRKGSVQSYGEAIRAGRLKTKLGNEWKRLLAMDVSDVYYDAFTANGRLMDSAPSFLPGDKVHIRVVNGSSSTYFWLTYAGGKMTVIGNDGMPDKPVAVDKMIIGTAETYDIEVLMPDSGAYELRATPEDRIGKTSLYLGNGDRIPAPELGRLDYFAGMQMMNGMVKMNGDMNDMGMAMSLQQMDMNTVMYPELKTKKGKDMVVMDYAKLQSPFKTTLPEGPWRTLHFELTGNMNRYVWSINNRTVSESDKIWIKKGENVRIILYNGSMMRHPMHLHGHFFRVLNGKGDYSPLKNTLDIMPMETDTIEFHGSESGDWFFHCHILYHMMSGMGRIFSYENSPFNPQVPDPAFGYKMVQKDDKKYYAKAEIGLESNGSDGFAQLANVRNQFNAEWRVGLNAKTGYELEAHYGRYIGKMQWLMPYVGIDWRHHREAEAEKNLFGQVNTKNDRKALCLGVAYTMPLLIVGDARVATDGKFRVQFKREDIPLDKRLRMNVMWNTDKEWMAGLRYIVAKYISLSTHYDSDMGYGAGLTLNY